MSKVDDACAAARLLMNEIYAPNFGLLGVVAELFGAAGEPEARGVDVNVDGPRVETSLANVSSTRVDADPMSGESFEEIVFTDESC